MPGKNQNNERNRIFRVEEDNFAIIEAKVRYYSEGYVKIKDFEQAVEKLEKDVEVTRSILDRQGAYRTEQSRKIYAEQIKEQGGLEAGYQTQLEKLKRLKADMLRELDGENAALFENDSINEIYDDLIANVANHQQQANFAAV